MTLPSSDSSTNTHMYTNQSMEMTYNIDLEFGHYTESCYFGLVSCQYFPDFNFGIHIIVPQLS